LNKLKETNLKELEKIKKVKGGKMVYMNIKELYDNLINLCHNKYKL